MNLQQLRILQEAVRNGFNFTEAAAALNTSQSGVSKHIRDLEVELGVELFERRGKRMLGLTAAGHSVIGYAERILADAANIKHAARDLRDPASGELVIATTHLQARYTLPAIAKRFREEFPGVRLSIVHADPADIASRLRDGAAHIGIATEEFAQATDLDIVPYRNWRHVVIARRDDPFAGRLGLGLDAVATRPIVTYGAGQAGRPVIDAAFRARALMPDIVVSAMDSDVVKSCVALGMGLGIIAGIAFDETQDRDLVRIEGDLFPETTASIALPRGRFLPGYAHSFVKHCLSELDATPPHKATA